MGRIAQLRDGRSHPLTAETVVGRGPSADLQLREDFVSNLHAALAWVSGAGWSARDLGSRNGTAVNGDTLPAGTRRRLQKGDELSFGQASETWTLVDDSEPAPFALAPDHDPVMGSNGLLVLPDDEAPTVTIFHSAMSCWKAEDHEGVRQIADRTTVMVGETIWTIRLPAPIAPTRGAIGSRRALGLRDVALSIVQSDEQRGGSVVVASDAGDEFSFPVGTALDVLSLLARARNEDPSGWIDRERILDELSMTGNRLNVSVFRLRRQFADAGFIDGAQIVERSHRRLRLGCKRVRLV